MKPSIRQKLDLLVDRLDEIDRMLSAPSTASDMDQFRKLSRERAEIEPVIVQFNAFRQAERDLEEAEAMHGDPEMREFAEEEIAATKARLPGLETDLQKLLLPRDPNDEKSVILEIRAGTGGDESALFAGDLFRMYSRFAERQRWQVEVLSASESDLGGYRATIARMTAKAASLGARHTRAMSPSGLDGPGWETLTSPHDLALIYRAALTYPIIAQIMRQPTAQFPDRGGYKTLTAQNKLLARYPGDLAGKTGYTDLAGDTFVTVAQRDGRRLAVVLMKGDGPLWDQAVGLLDWGFAQPR